MLRSFAATITGVLAAVLLPLTLVSVWAHGVVSDTDTYVTTVTPLADEPAVKAAAVTELERGTLALINGGHALPPGTEGLVHLAVQHVVDSAAFRATWVQANRTAHDQAVAILEDRSTATTASGGGQVTIDLTPELRSIAATLAADGLISSAQADKADASITLADGGRLAKARRAYDALDTLRLWLPPLWAVLVLLTLLLARRRLATLARLAVASLLALGLVALALFVARDAVTQDLAQRAVARAVWDVVVSSLWHEIELAAVVLVVVAVVAAVLAALRGRAATRPAADGAS